MIVFRLTRKKYARILSGKGAALNGNRWNSKGIEMIYTADSRAMAMAELAVHLTLATLPKDFLMMEIEIPDKIRITAIKENELPLEWNTFPHNAVTQKIGDQFVSAKEFCVLKAPSAVVKGDYNYLINPYHVDFGEISILNTYDFPIDKRIFK